MDAIFLQEFLSKSHDETKWWLKRKRKINTLKKAYKVVKTFVVIFAMKSDHNKRKESK